MSTKTIITLFICATTFFVVAQDDITDQIAISGDREEFFLDAINGEDDNYYVVATSGSDGTSGTLQVPEHDGNLYIILTKFNDENELVWQKSYYGSGSDYSKKLVKSDDGLYLLGHSSSPVSGNKTTEKYGLEDWQADYWLLKLDFDGNIMWDKSYGSDNGDEASDLIILPSGELLIAGVSRGDASGVKSEDAVTESKSDYWIVKTTAEGDIIWDKTIGSPDFDSNPSLTQLDNGKIIIAGMSRGDKGGSKTDDNFGNNNAWIIAIKEDGDILWDKTFGGTDGAFGGVAYTKNNLIYLIINSLSGMSGNRSVSLKGEQDIWFLKLDDEGEVLSELNFGGDGQESANQVIFQENDRILLAASSDSDNSIDKEDSNRGFSDYWPILINNEGEILWQKTIGGIHGDILKKVLVRPNNKLLLIGQSDSGISADRTVENHSEQPNANNENDVWIVEIDASILNTENEEINLNNVSVYPNPFASDLTIEVDNLEVLNEVIITDVNGKVYWSKEKKDIEGSEFTIPLDNLSKGVYLVNIKSKNSSVIKRVVKN